MAKKYKHSIYSFPDVHAVLSRPNTAPFVLSGEGIGDFTVEKSRERSAYNLAADGCIMTSKMEGNDGYITINCQQSSSLNKYLQSAFNALWIAETDDWCGMGIEINASKMGVKHVCTRGSFEKEADRSYQREGQMVTWRIHFDDITTTDLNPVSSLTNPISNLLSGMPTLPGVIA